jgi:hypothetical protein
MAWLEEIYPTLIRYKPIKSREILESLDYLFDVAHQVAITLIKIEDYRQFLLAQKETYRRGTIGGVDHALTLQEKHTRKRGAAEKIQSK